MPSFIGIDLGTTFSAVATIDETGRPSIVHNQEGQNITPSCLAQTSEGVMQVGEEARKQWGVAPDTAASRFKRDMGTPTNHKINGKEFTPTELSTLLLKRLVQDTEKTLGSIGEAVVTIPANFAHAAREATMASAKAAGLTVNHIINEPTAAALYYAFKSDGEISGTYAVYDLGGGTFDISVIQVDGKDVEVLATNGVSRLGGDDFDKALQNLVRAKFKEQTGEDLAPDDFTLNDAEVEKKSLSKREKIIVTIRAARTTIDIQRDEFEEAISSLIMQAQMLCEGAIDEAGIKTSDLKGVILAGGSTRIPAVKQSVKNIFQQEPISTSNVDEVVALGAALYAAYKGDRSNLSAVQKNAIQKIKVSELTSQCFGTLSLRHDNARDQHKLTNTIIIKKGEKIPCSITESFYTVFDGQEGVDCEVTESTAPETDPRFVKVIWKGDLELPPGRPANQEIKVTFAYDENQIMKVSFEDVDTGKEVKKDLSMTAAKAKETDDEISKFTVE